ncbi:MAG: thioredoxin domain-containing protein [bacterium]
MLDSETKGFFESGTPRVMFYFGLVTGMAAILLVNTVYAMNGGSLKLGANNIKAEPAVAANVPTNPTAVQPEEPAAAPVKGVQADDHLRGNKNASVVIIEYSDFQCPYCSKQHPVMQQLMTEFPNQIAWVHRNFPLTSIHPQAEPAANAAECASEQGKFWEFADALYGNQGSLSDAFYEQTAKDVGVNVAKFKTCYGAKKYSSRIAQDVDEGSAAGVDGTPASFINGQLVSGALPIETFRQMIQSQL